MMMVLMKFYVTPLTFFLSLDFLNLDLYPESDDEDEDEDDSDNGASDALAHEGSGFCCFNKLMAAQSMILLALRFKFNGVTKTAV